MRRLLPVPAVVSAMLVATSFSCGDGNPPPTGMDPGVPITVAVAPANAVPVNDPEFPFAAGFTVQIFETTGDTGVEILEIVVTLQNPVVYSQQQVLLAAGSTRVPPNGSLEVPLAIGLTTNGITAELVVRARGDDGSTFEALGRLVVVPAQGP